MPFFPLKSSVFCHLRLTHLRCLKLRCLNGMQPLPLPLSKPFFRGKVVVLCNEMTASDGEGFCLGARTLLGAPLVGSRTWGGFVWIADPHVFVDGGMLTVPAFGVAHEDGKEWLIEGRGVEPDIVVDNMPVETFGGKDRQLEAGVSHLLGLIDQAPMEAPKRPDPRELQQPPAPRL
jgi:tricorn protease